MVIWKEEGKEVSRKPATTELGCLVFKQRLHTWSDEFFRFYYFYLSTAAKICDKNPKLNQNRGLKDDVCARTCRSGVLSRLCSDWMIPCKRSSLISPLRMTKSDPLQLPLLLSTAADKKLPAGGINMTLTKPTNADPTQVAHRAVTDSCNRSVSHTCETDPYQVCYSYVLQEICLEFLCFTGFGNSLFYRSGTDLLSFCNT
jgi:hypothetical protein